MIFCVNLTDYLLYHPFFINNECGPDYSEKALPVHLLFLVHSVIVHNLFRSIGDEWELQRVFISKSPM